MRYLSVCSGIEAATVAWHPLGWTPAAFSEIEAFPRAVLAHHYPEVPCHGDFTTIGADDYGPIDLLVGGTPCQSFSIAGLRKGLADERGNLALEFLRLADRKSPRWLVWENVPGVLSSNGGRDFGAFLGGLVELGYGFAYRVLDAQFFGVAQRRRRVFVVGYLGDWRRAAAVLFERHSLSGHPAPRRKAREDVAGSLTSRASGGGGGPGAGTDEACAGYLQAVGFGYKEFAQDATFETSPPLRALGAYDANGGAGTAVAIQERAVSENPDAGPDGAGFRDDGAAYTLEARTVPQAVAFNLRGREEGAQPEADPDNLAAMRAASGGSSRSYVAFNARQDPTVGPVADPLGTKDTGHGIMLPSSAVRRLTPTECERLQGFPDSYTAVPYRGKQAADGPRYKALGNSMAVPVMAWIGERIAAVEVVIAERIAA